eukprot:3063610-Pleurochrysis_carterae.AAC.3
MASAMARSTARVKPSWWKYSLPGSMMPKLSSAIPFDALPLVLRVQLLDLCCHPVHVEELAV